MPNRIFVTSTEKRPKEISKQQTFIQLQTHFFMLSLFCWKSCKKLAKSWRNIETPISCLIKLQVSSPNRSKFLKKSVLKIFYGSLFHFFLLLFFRHINRNDVSSLNGKCGNKLKICWMECFNLYWAVCGNFLLKWLTFIATMLSSWDFLITIIGEMFHLLSFLFRFTLNFSLNKCLYMKIYKMFANP